VSWEEPSASDNCGLADFTPDILPGAVFSVGTTTVTYTATDVNGNESTATFTVTVKLLIINNADIIYIKPFLLNNILYQVITITDANYKNIINSLSQYIVSTYPPAEDDGVLIDNTKYRIITITNEDYKEIVG